MVELVTEEGMRKNQGRCVLYSVEDSGMWTTTIIVGGWFDNSTPLFLVALVDKVACVDKEDSKATVWHS